MNTDLNICISTGSNIFLALPSEICYSDFTFKRHSAGFDSYFFTFYFSRDNFHPIFPLLEKEAQMKQFHTIFDRVAKRCLSLSPKTTIQLINGLYGTNYPLDSPVAVSYTHLDVYKRQNRKRYVCFYGNIRSRHVSGQKQPCY